MHRQHQRPSIYLAVPGRKLHKNRDAAAVRKGGFEDFGMVADFPGGRPLHRQALAKDLLQIEEDLAGDRASAGLELTCQSLNGGVGFGFRTPGSNPYELNLAR